MTTVLPSVEVELAQRPKATGRPARRMWTAAFSQAEFKVGLTLLFMLMAASLIYPLVVSFSATTMNVSAKFLPPVFLEGGTWTHPLGTDQLGRDLLLRALVGLKNALSISVSAVAMTLIIGATVGMLAGYYGGWVDTVLMRLTDAQLAIPLIILAVTILTVHRPTPLLVILVLGLSSWPAYARIIRSVMLGERRREYVRAAKILGASDIRTIFLLIAPNILPPVLFVAVLEIARMMIFEAILGFIGIGVQPPTPTFGNVIADGRNYLINAWWIATMPGAFLFATLLSINLIGACVERARDMMLRGSI